MNEEKETYEQSSWSFRKYFKGVKRYKWWVIGATLLGTVVGFVSFKFILNPQKKVLSATYTYNLAADLEKNSTSTYRFIDGTLFDCFDIVTKENMQAVKDSDKKTFEHVNIDKIYSKSEISVEKITTTNTNNSTEISYRVTSKAKNFPSDEVGKQYLYTLINYPKEISTKAIEKYAVDSYFQDDVSKEDFSKQIDLAKKQYEVINSTYKKLQSTFSTSTVVDDQGTKLYQAYNSFESRYNDGTLDKIDFLLNSMYSNYFVNYEKGKEAAKITELENMAKSYIRTIGTYKNEKAVYESQLSDINASQIINSGSDTTYTNKIWQLNELIKDYRLKIENLNTQLNLFGYYEESGEYKFKNVPSIIKNLTEKNSNWVQANDAFKESVKDIIVDLEEDRMIATNAYKTVYSNNKNKVTLINSGYVTLSNEVNNFIGLAVGFVAGYLISSFVVAAIYIYKNEDKKEAEAK